MRLLIACFLFLQPALGQAGEPAGALTDASVRALVQRWLEAQNQGDRASYEALYAERFAGVRRSGPRVVRMNRARWMADRARMFRKPMKVGAAELKVTLAAGTGRASFSQSWESGSYRDEGPKELLVVLDKGALRIAREVMVASKVAAPPALRPPPVGEVALVVALGGPRVVLDAAPQAEWEKGDPREVASDEGRAVRFAVDLATLPAELKRWRGKKLALYDATAKRCEATVVGLSIYGRATPHFGTEAEWRGEGDGKKLPPAKVAEEIRGLAEEGTFLAADLDLKECKGALFARDAALPPPGLVPAQPATGAIEDAALRAFRRLPEYTTIQRDYRGEGGKGRWENSEHGEVGAVLLRSPRKRVVVVAAQAGTGCGGFTASLWAAFSLAGSESAPLLTLVSQPGEGDFNLTPQAAVDAADGRTVILYGPDGFTHEQGLLVPDGAGRYFALPLVKVPFHDCGC